MIITTSKNATKQIKKIAKNFSKVLPFRNYYKSRKRLSIQKISNFALKKNIYQVFVFRKKEEYLMILKYEYDKKGFWIWRKNALLIKNIKMEKELNYKQPLVIEYQSKNKTRLKKFFSIQNSALNEIYIGKKNKFLIKENKKICFLYNNNLVFEADFRWVDV